jgi:hypothetical protein
VKSAKLLPGHEKRPANPLPEGPRPGTKYRVRNGDTWESVAKKNKVTVRELIANNCGTNVTPEEINWYLHVRVGCDETRDNRNWSFSDSANPGHIYIPAPGTVPASSQNPQINTLYGGPKDLGCGGVEWLVEFKLPRKAEGDGWIIQQILRSYDIREADGSVADANLNAPKVTFWEAWPVKKGAIITSNRYDATDDGRTYDDSFDQPERPNLKGEFKVIGLVKFYEVALPSTFVKQNLQTRAEDLLSTTVRPDFWDGTGTIHNLTITWDCTDPKNKSAPKITTLVLEKK